MGARTVFHDSVRELPEQLGAAPSGLKVNAVRPEHNEEKMPVSFSLEIPKGAQEELEEKVRETSERLRELKDENRDLRGQLEDLETRLAAATTDPAPSSEESAMLAHEREQAEALRERVRELEVALAEAEQAGTIRDTWMRERDEIRDRVESLTRELAELVS